MNNLDTALGLSFGVYAKNPFELTQAHTRGNILSIIYLNYN